VEDHWKGLAPAEGQTGIGLVAMRERAEILGGALTVSALGTPTANAGGTVVRLRIPRARVEAHGE